MTQPRLTREPEDGRIERWFTERERRLPPPDRAAVLGGALKRLPQTPQRRRWRLLRWLPFGIGATRSSVPAEPRAEGRTHMMFSATRLAALVAVLAVGGSLALVAGPLAPPAEAPVVPGAEAPGPEAAAPFNGSGGVKVNKEGEKTTIDGVPHLLGQVTEMPARLIEVDDPRVSGTQTYTQYAADYGGFGPSWGTFRIEDGAGAWVGEVSGIHVPSSGHFSGWLTGEGAYEGLVLYYRGDHGQGFNVTFSGVIYPAAAPPLELEVGLTD